MLVMMVCLLAGCATEPVNKNPYNVEVLNHTSDFYVNDFAGILSEDQKSDMMERAVQLDTEYSGIQVVVSIVESFEKTVVSYEGDASTNMVYDIEQLAYAMYDQYGIGQDDMGILIFFSVGDREVRIETGYQMQTYITDQKSGQLLDNNGMEYFRNDQFADGLVAVQAATIEEIRQIVPANWNEFVEADETEQEEPADKQEDAPVVNSGTTSADETEKDPNKGILAGLIGIICAMFAAIGAFFYNLFTGKKRREAEAAAHAKELSDQKANYEKEIASINGAHKAKLDQVANRYKTDMTTKQQEIDSLRGQLTMESNRHDDTRRQLSMLEEKFQRVQILHPEYDFNQEVVDMIEGEFKEEARFILSDIKSIKMNAFELPSGKRNRIKQHFIITLFFYNNKKLTYPIQSTSHDDLKQRYEKFASYLEDNKINEYEDIKKNNIAEMILLIITCNIIMSLIVLIINIRKRNRMKNSL